MNFVQQFDDRLFSSLYLFLYHKLVRTAKGFTEHENIVLNKEEDERLPGYDIYPSKFGQWVFDDPETAVNAQAGEIVDYSNGRILIPQNSNPDTITRNFTSSTFNLYNNQEDLEVLVDKSLQAFKERYDNPNTFAAPYKYHSPAIFLSEATARNDPFSFGGGDMNNTTFRAVVLSDNQWYSSSALSFLKDLSQHCFVLLDDYGDFPLNNLGDLKDAYSYEGLIEKYSDQKSKPYIEVAHKSNIRSFGSLGARQNATMWGGFVEFDIRTYRETRKELAAM